MPEKHVHSLTYRPDIDGLRAIAVISVILFHAFPSLLPGGFVGVDIFFVISGFLITSIILKTGESKRNFISTFYERRIRRLIPPAIPVILFTLVMGFMLLPAEDLKELAQSVLANTAFVSNWFFLEQSGYFDGPSHYKPLLHTWSLSVEEQFYLIFPIIILLLRKRPKILTTLMFLGVIVFSFILGLYFLKTANSEAAFFNSFARFWQIGLGGFLASIARNKTALNHRQKEILGALGLMMIFIGLWLLSPETPFPSFRSTIPVLGVVFLIFSGLPNETKSDNQSSTHILPFANRILAIRPIVAIGLISYALYLWHWPIFVYLKYAISNPKYVHYIAAIALTFGLAIVSYFFIEKPFRSKQIIKTQRGAYIAFISSSLIIMAITIFPALSSSPISRFENAAAYTSAKSEQLRAWTEQSLKGECWKDHRVDMEPIFEKCARPKPDMRNILLVGDSHAAHLLPGLRKNYQDINISLLAVDSCTMTLEIDPTRPACVALNDWLQKQSFSEYDALLISSRTPPSNNDGLIMLKDIGEKIPVYVIGPIPFYEPNQRTIYEQMVGSYPRKDIEKRFDEALSPIQAKLDKSLKKTISQIRNVKYISLYNIICPQRKCQHFDANGLPILIDNSHMSITASAEVMSKISTQSYGILKPNHFKGYELGRFENLLNWTPQAGASVNIIDDIISVDLPPDGRLKHIFKMPETNSKIEMTFSMKLESSVNEDVVLNLILQNGCEHAVKDGASFDVFVPKSTIVIKQVALLNRPTECGMVRIWSRKGQHFKGQISDINITLKSRQ